MSDTGATTLYRPVGQKELDMIRESGWAAFPPRLPFQPIFYIAGSIEIVAAFRPDPPSP